MNIIAECKIKKSAIDPDVTNAWVRFEGEDEWNVLFTFYSNEITINASELVGLKDSDALALKWARDKEYFQS